MNWFGDRAPAMSRFSTTIHAGCVSGGVLAPPILITPRSSFQKLSCVRVTAFTPVIMGSAPVAGSGTPWTTMGCACVPTRQITHLSA